MRGLPKEARILARCAAAAAAVLAGCVAAPSPAPPNPLQPALGALLRGDAFAALQLMERIEAPLTAKQAEAARCVRERFAGRDPEVELPAVSASILAAYRGYWRASLMKTADTAALEAGLARSLRDIGALDAANGAVTLDTLGERVVKAIEADGLHALTGKTEPYYELMIWRTQEERTYNVALPERSVHVRVVFLDGFASLGWAAFATCDVAHTGGWAKPDALYAVRSSYDLASETFRVSYLAHEGQHFADYSDYPMLEQPELEYRAKLTEIALSSATTAELRARFAATGGDSRAAPHAFANRQVSLALEGVPPERVRAAARAKLAESSATLRRVGAKGASRFLPN
jgi:hypothetical protein